jgi:hypothetical protein
MSDTNGKLTPAQVEALVRAELPTLKVDQGKIKLREWDDLEEAADRPVTPWVGANFPPLWFIRGVLWLWLRRDHPALTWDDMGELDTALLFEASEAAKAALGIDTDEEKGTDPTSGSGEPTAGEPPPQPSPTSVTSGG